MTVNARALLRICSLIPMVWMLASCSGLIDPGTKDYSNSSEGLVKIYLEPSDGNTGDSAKAAARTLLPVTTTATYGLSFLSGSGKQVTVPPAAMNGPLTQALETGTWTVTVTRYETADSVTRPVASGTSSFTVTAGATSNVNVVLSAITGGTGVFSYTINLTGISATASLTLRAKTGGLVTSIPAVTTNGKQYLNLPSGDYDVFLSLLTSDGRGAGAYSAACVYSGLETPWAITFTAANFVTDVYLAGSVNITGTGVTAAGSTVTVTAHNLANTSQTWSVPSYSWTSTSQEWVMRIDPGVPSVYFTVDVLANGVHYTSPSLNAHTENNIGANGRGGIGLSIAINKITSGSWPLGNTIAASVGGVPRTAATPGETVNLAVTSTYGLKPGTLTASYSGGPVTVTGYGTTYSFTMPAGDVSINASFYTGDATLSFTLSDGVTSITQNDAANITQIDPKNIQVQFPAASTAGSVTLSVTPPAGAVVLGTNSTGIYTLTSDSYSIVLYCVPDSGVQNQMTYTFIITRPSE